MSLEDRFRAAVKIVHCLPKEGPFQPPISTKLKFYGLYKLATEGSANSSSKPGFWDVVGRTKWETWNKLGDMTKDEAMLQYVNGLKEMVETYFNDAQDFIGVIGPFYEFVTLQGDDMKHIKDKIEEVTSSVSNFIIDPSSETSNCNGEEVPEKTNEVDNHAETKVMNTVKAGLARSSATSENEDDEVFTDCTPFVHFEDEIQFHKYDNSSQDRKFTGSAKINSFKADTAVRETVGRLNRDVDHIMARLRTLELAYAANAENAKQAERKKSNKSWCLFDNLSPKSVAFIIMWPFVAHFMVRFIQLWWLKRKNPLAS